MATLKLYWGRRTSDTNAHLRRIAFSHEKYKVSVGIRTHSVEGE
jgi:hypothetical protein